MHKEAFEIALKKDPVKFKILEATEKLVMEKPLDRVGVTEICKVASISRQTFYTHFESKFEIPRWCWTFLAEAYLKEEGRSLTVCEALCGMIKYSERFRGIFYSTPYSSDYERLESYGARLHVNYLRDTLADYYGLEVTDDLQFQIEFFVDGVSRVVYAAGRSMQKIEPEALALSLEKCLPAGLASVLGTSANPKADPR